MLRIQSVNYTPLLCAYLDMDDSLLLFDEIENESTDEPIVDTPVEALVKCINRFGKVNLRWIVKSTELKVDDVLDNLKGLIYQNPATWGRICMRAGSWLMNTFQVISVGITFTGTDRTSLNSLEYICFTDHSTTGSFSSKKKCIYYFKIDPHIEKIVLSDNDSVEEVEFVRNTIASALDCPPKGLNCLFELIQGGIRDVEIVR